MGDNADAFGDRITTRRIEALGEAVDAHHGGDRMALRRVVRAIDVRAPEWSAVDGHDPERTTATEVRWLLECDADRNDGSAHVVTTEVAGRLSAAGRLSEPVVRHLVRGNEWQAWRPAKQETAVRAGRTLRQAAAVLALTADR